MQIATTDIALDASSHDQWTYIWGAAKYASNLYYKFCFREITPHDAFKWLWKAKCVPKIKFFCWLLLSDRLNSRNMLKKKALQHWE